MIDVGTIGSSPAAVTLNAMLIETADGKLTHSVMSLLANLGDTMRKVEGIHDLALKEEIVNLYRDDYIKKIDDKNIPAKFKSYMKNIVVTRCRAVINMAHSSTG